MKKITELNHIEARQFLLKEESYCNFDLPKYFMFGNIIQNISNTIGANELETFYLNFDSTKAISKRNPAAPYPSDFDDVNYILLNNKDGKFAWRPFQLIHPALYVGIVHKITEEQNWNLIITRFNEFKQNPKIICHSIPVQSEDDSSDKATTITNWWQAIEQNSIELALMFEYVLHTDITDCYGSIYTHSIPWALHTKPTAKQNRGFGYVGNVIDKYLRDMAYGQTNGIPQGSVLMDFIAEMVLGYADLELSNKIANSNIGNDYCILRYRDDYRIFANNPQVAEKIAKFLTEVLIELGMRLNAQKTLISNDVVKSSIKPDKLYWNSTRSKSKGLQSQLLLINQLAEKFPNSGTMSKALDKFFKRITKIETTKENINVLISILVDIAFKNPRTYPVVCGILSKLLSLIDDSTKQIEILNLIGERFKRIPNTGHIKIWLQRVTLKIDRSIVYDETLCKKLNDNSIKIWNSDWLNPTMSAIIDTVPIINEQVIIDINKVINPSEIQVFDFES